MRRRLFILLILIVAIAAAFFAVRRRQTASSQEFEIIRQAEVTRDSIAATVSAAGSIEPEALVSLSFGIGGPVRRVNVVRGQEVEAGDVLAALDTEELSLAVQSAEDAVRIQELTLQLELNNQPSPATLAGAQADIDSAQGQLVIAEANLTAAEAALAQAQAGKAQLLAGATPGQIAAAESQLVSARLQQQNAEEAHNRTLQCFTVTLPGGESEETCPALGPAEEAARSNLENANAALQAAEANLNDLLADPRPADLASADAAIAAAQAQVDSAAGNILVAEANLARAEASLARLQEGPTDDRVAVLEAQVDSAATNLALAELRLDQAVAVTPIAGRVASILVREGEQAAPGAPVLIVVDEDAFHLEVSVDEIDIDRISIGQEVEIDLDALPDVQATGIIADIAPTAATSGVGVVTYQVTINIAAEGVELRQGMTANASIVVEEIADVLVVPNWAVRLDRESGQAFVNLLAAGGTVEEVPIEIGLRNEQFSRVLSGLDEGDVVVVTNEREGLSFFGG